MSTVEEEDIVVTEIPVLLSQALAKNLYLFQYPTRPGTTDWNDTKCVNSLIKPMNKQVRLEFAVDTYTDKYCPSKGEQIALNTDGQPESSRYVNNKEREKAQYFKSGTMDKLSYESIAPDVSSNYAVAILQDKELHCTPVHGIVQLRPSYSYFDKQDKRVKETKRADNSEDEDEDEPVQPQQVTVSFARQESEGAKKARESSFEFVSKRSAEEPWCDTVWRHADTDHADLERLKLFCPNTSMGAALSLPATEYLPSLVPPPPAEEMAAPDASSTEHPDLRSIHQLTLVEQCKALLKDAKLLSFSELSELIRPPVDKSTLAGALSTAGCCVRGVWAPLSSALCHQRAAAVRDYVLYQFTQSPYVDRRKISAVVRLPPEEILEILQTVAKCNSRTGWELLIPPDPTFEATFPDIVQRQNLYWEAKNRQFHEMITNERDAPKRQRKKSQRDSIGSDTMLSPKARCNSTGDEDSDKKRQKSKCAIGTGKRTRNHSVGNESAL